MNGNSPFPAFPARGGPRTHDRRRAGGTRRCSHAIDGMHASDRAADRALVSCAYLCAIALTEVCLLGTEFVQG